MRITRTLLPLLFAATVLHACTPPQIDSTEILDEEKFVFETWSKQTAEGFRGSFEVPENRHAQNSRMIPIKYVRFKATGEQPGPPIIYLAGGPGGSGIMTVNYRFPMFMALREYGDVIALDQRGTGASNIVPECQSSQAVPATTRVSDHEYIEYHQNALRECLAFWKAEGADIAGYNTLESAHDLDALRQHLGAEKIILWGTSYGSHLALAALKEIEDKIERVVISSAEGLNQTIKMPAGTDAYLDRLQAAINSQPGAKAAYPDIKALMRRVHGKLDDNPLPLQLTLRDGSKADFLLHRRDMQELAGGFIADPSTVATLFGFYLAIDKGGAPAFDGIPARFFPDRFVAPEKPITLNAMSTAMDIASGMTRERKAKIAEQAKTALLKDFLNFSYHFDGIAPELDLGDEFRTKPTSDVPVLLLSGTLDGRTYIGSQLEAVSELVNVTSITVENAGHNLFMSSHEIQKAINRFMEDKPTLQPTITVELPNMAL